MYYDLFVCLFILFIGNFPKWLLFGFLKENNLLSRNADLVSCSNVMIFVLMVFSVNFVGFDFFLKIVIQLNPTPYLILDFINYYYCYHHQLCCFGQISFFYLEHFSFDEITLY